MLKRVNAAWGAAAFLLAGCASNPKDVSLKLSGADPLYGSHDCQTVRSKVLDYDDKVGQRIAIGLASGLLLGPFGIPIAAQADSAQNDERNRLNLELMRSCVSGAEIGADGELRIVAPVTGRLGGKSMTGQAVTTGATGQFWIQGATGLRCEGTYNSRDTTPSLVIPVTCTELDTGATISGHAVATRDARLLQSGTGTVELDNGTTGEFVFGLIRFDDAFPAAQAHRGR